MTQIHFIEQQKLYFEFTSEEKAKEWNKKTTTFYREEILPVLEKLFDKHIPAERWYSIPSLEIDLGNIHSRDFKNVLSKQIEAQLIGLLEKEEVFHALPEHLDDAAPAKYLQIKSQGQKLLETFYTFLKHGILPWNSQINTTKLLEQEINQHIGVDKLSSLPELRRCLEHYAARERLLYQFTRSFQEEILRSVFSKELKPLIAFKNFILENLHFSSLDPPSIKKIKGIVSGNATSWISSERSDQPETWLRAIIFSLFEKMVKSQTDINPIFDFIKTLITVHESEIKIESNPAAIKLIQCYAAEFIASRESDKPSLKSSKTFKEDAKPTQNQKAGSDFTSLEGREGNGDSSSDGVTSAYGGTPGKADKIRAMKLSEDSLAGSTNYSKPFSKNTKGDDVMRPSDVAQTKDEISISKESTPPGLDSEIIRQHELKRPTNNTLETTLPDTLQEYFILNAGLVLCWPYLTQLFKRTGYLVDKHFKDEKRHQRAVHLLGYLAGFEEGDEHQLTIAKLLTNWPLSKPVIKWLKLNSKEKKEATDMLANMISNWPILKNTSVEGLQTSFFHREGKLKKEEQGWKLIVEQKSYDMLLDHLSYSIAIIKLPWMEKVLKVDWA